MNASGWVESKIGDFLLTNSWDIKSGEISILFGGSGAGKSLTLKTIAGINTPQKGHIEIGGVPVFDSKSEINIPPHKRKIGYMPQDYGLFPNLNARKNIEYGISEESQSYIYDKTNALIDRLQLTSVAERNIDALSGGERQRVALARALATSPKMLLLDEPFAALDLDLKRSARQEIRSILISENIPVLLVTHDIEEALTLGDHVQVIQDGTVIDSGTPVATLTQPNSIEISQLTGVENILELEVAELLPKEGIIIARFGKALILEVPYKKVEPGTTVYVGLKASDIIFATKKPETSALSARNILPGTVKTIEKTSVGYEVVIESKDGLLLDGHITRRSLEQLNLKVGDTLWSIFKTSALFILDS